MATESFRKNSALLDWKNEKKYQETILKNQKASASAKTAAKARIKEADTMIKKIGKK